MDKAPGVRFWPGVKCHLPIQNPGYAKYQKSIGGQRRRSCPNRGRRGQRITRKESMFKVWCWRRTGFCESSTPTTCTRPRIGNLMAPAITAIDLRLPTMCQEPWLPLKRPVGSTWTRWNTNLLLQARSGPVNPTHLFGTFDIVQHKCFHCISIAVPCRNGLADSRSTGNVQQPLNSIDQCFSICFFFLRHLTSHKIDHCPHRQCPYSSVSVQFVHCVQRNWQKRYKLEEPSLKPILFFVWIPADIWKQFFAHNGGRRSRETHYKKALRPLQQAPQPKRSEDCSQASTEQSKELVAAQKSAIKLLEVNSNQKSGLGTEEVEKHTKRLRTKIGVQAASFTTVPPCICCGFDHGVIKLVLSPHILDSCRIIQTHRATCVYCTCSLSYLVIMLSHWVVLFCFRFPILFILHWVCS